jgi:hypothetical protein
METLFDDFNVSLEEFTDPPLLTEGEVSAANDLMKTAISLEGMLQELHKTQSISRDQAQFLSETCGVDFGKRYPLSSFTKDPTPVNFSVATEGAVTEFFTSIGAFIRKVIQVILGILKWIWDVLTGVKNRQKAVETVVQNAAVINKVNKEVEAIVGRKAKPATDNRSPSELAFVAAKEKYEKNWTEWRNDVVTDSDFMKTLKAYSELFAAYEPHIEARVKVFKELMEIKEDPNDLAQAAELTARFARAAIPLPVTAFIQLFSKGHVDLGTGHKPGNEITFQEVAEALSRTIADKIATAQPDSVEFDSSIDVILSRPDINKSLLTGSEQEARLLNALISEYKQMLNADPKQVYSDKLRERYRTVIDSLTSDVRAMQISVTAFSQADAATASMVRDVADCVFCYNVHLEEVVGQLDPESESAKRCHELIKKARDVLKRIRP